MGATACSLKAAIESEDATVTDSLIDTPYWLAHHLTVGLRLLALPEKPAVDYKVGRKRLVEESTGFILRGLGVKPEVIKERYDSTSIMKSLS